MKTNKATPRNKPTVSIAGASLIALMVTSCATSTDPQQEPDANQDLGMQDDEYTLEDLIAAAQDEEGELVVYDVTGQIVDTAEAFEEKYNIETTGVKANSEEQQEIIIRESESGNVQGDAFFMTDQATVAAELLPTGVGVSWIPPDLEEDIEEKYREPLAITTEVNVWTYNSDTYEQCPVDNMWELTTDEWSGNVTFPDPLLRNDFLNWVNQVEMTADDEVAQAYEDYFGSEVDTTDGTATAQWLSDLAGNSPMIQQSGGDASDAVGPTGQEDPPVGMLSTAQFRDNENQGYALELCDGISPWIGRSYTKNAVIASGTSNPNSAKLFIHYMLSEEGIEPQLHDGKFSTNNQVPASDQEPSGIANLNDQVFDPDPEVAADDYDRLSEWQDLWTTSR